jgi:hypothetical protein
MKSPSDSIIGCDDLVDTGIVTDSMFLLNRCDSKTVATAEDAMTDVIIVTINSTDCEPFDDGSDFDLALLMAGG